MTGIQDKRRAIRHLLREDEPADAMAAYYALHHPDDKTTLVVPPTAEGQRANGYVALSRTGIDLFRPLVTMRLPTDRDPAAVQAAADLLRLALGSGQPAILSAPVRYLPLLRALFDIQSEELRLVYGGKYTEHCGGFGRRLQRDRNSSQWLRALGHGHDIWLD